MPMYMFCCPACGKINEEFFHMNDYKLLTCECGVVMDRIYTPPQIQGDTVAGGYSWDYYCDTLECHVKSKQHRAEIMKRRNLREWDPDLKRKAITDEMMYQMKHARPGDREEKKEVKRKGGEAAQKMMRERRREMIRKDTMEGIEKAYREATHIDVKK